LNWDAMTLLDSCITTLRRWRHGPLRWMDPLWYQLGRAYRYVLRRSPWQMSTPMRIGNYGPFRMDGQLAFSAFEPWGDRHNAGFAACVEACRGRRCVLDVGAHIGLVSLPMASVLAPGGRVFAFEPARANRVLLDRHVALNGFASTVIVQQDLVGATEEQAVPFFEHDAIDGMNSVVIKKHPERYVATPKRQVTLDGFCARLALQPEVIKIDVEGYEIHVLRGMEQLLRTVKPVVFLSVHPAAIQLLGLSLDVLWHTVAQHGYCFHDVVRQIPLASAADLAMGEYLMLPVSESIEDRAVRS
jgi:FkbM family methyltransferase